MKFLNFNDQELLNALTSKAQAERNLNLEIIELLEEVDRRKLFLEQGYGSLLEFCVKVLKYSESAAYRRISAMKVVRDVPEVKQSITEGSLNLVTVAQAQTFINQERKYNHKIYSKEEKKDLLLNLENKSKRECDKILMEISPDLPKQEKVRQITESKTQITLTLDQSLIEKLDQLKQKYSHINPNATYAELIEIMATKLLQRENQIKTAQPVPRHTAQPPGGASRYIPATIKKEVHARDKGQCTYVNPRTKQNCNSKHQLQYDHRYPMSLGGETAVNNLRLLCSSHHKLMTENLFGKFQIREQKTHNQRRDF